MKIYTKQGDAGLSSLFDGTRVLKNHPRLLAYGTLDELNSHLGLAICQCPHAELTALLQTLQRRIFDLSADLATPPGSKNEAKVRRIAAADVTALEQQIDAATAQLPPLKHFILPGGGLTAARLHVARTVCRRAEALIVAIPEFAVGLPAGGASSGGSPASIEDRLKAELQRQALIFVNRLSDLLFTLARLANKLDGVQDVEWIPDPLATREAACNKPPPPAF